MKTKIIPLNCIAAILALFFCVNCARADFQRLSKLTLSTTYYRSLYSAVIDPSKGYAYFATSHGWLIKVDISGPVPVEVGGLAIQSTTAEVIDRTHGYAYFAIPTTPGKIMMVNLGAGGSLPTIVGSLTLNTGENGIWGAVIDEQNGYAYFATNTSPSSIVKIALNPGPVLPVRVGAVALNSGENSMRRGVIDTANGYAYFASAGMTPSVIVKIALGSGSNPPTRIGAITLNGTETNVGSALIDTANGYAYFGTYNSSATVVKVALGAGNNPPTRVGALRLPSGDRELSTGVIDTAAGFAYFGTDHMHPARIFKVGLGFGSSLPVLAQTLQLNPGSLGMGGYPPDGQNIVSADAGLYGELYLQSSVFDPISGCAYFGTDTVPGQVVKVKDIFSVDVTSPTAPAQVRDGTGTDIDAVYLPWCGAAKLMSSLTYYWTLSANWDASSDPESGISRYEYCIGTVQGGTDTADWTNNGTATGVTRNGLVLAIGTTYYFAVKAVNGAGLESVPAYSDGQVFLDGWSPPPWWPKPPKGKILIGQSIVVAENLPAGSVFEIYSISGRRVHTLYEADSGGGTVMWDGKKANGRYISPGLYIYLLKDTQGNKTTGKITATR